MKPRQDELVYRRKPRKRDPLLQKLVDAMESAVLQGKLTHYEAHGRPQPGRPWSLYADGGKYYAHSMLDVLTILRQVGWKP